MYGILRNLSAAPRFTIVQVENGRKVVGYGGHRGCGRLVVG
jgi:hypothetical protein